MKIIIAYITVVFIWSTTPLAIQVTALETDFIFAVAARMVIGAVIALIISMLVYRQLPWNAHARKAYFAVGISIFGAMSTVYWGSQFIPSGWISVIYGMTPITTGVIGYLWFNNKQLTLFQLAGLFIALSGLVMIFYESMTLGDSAVLGIIGVCASVLIHSVSALWVKKIHAPVTALQQTTGGLLFSLPFFLISWILNGADWPQSPSIPAVAGILYLGIFGSVLGFVLYYYLLKAIDAIKLSIVTMLTPVIALYLGFALNNEEITGMVLLGTLVILLGLGIYQFAQYVFSDRLFMRKVQKL